MRSHLPTLVQTFCYLFFLVLPHSALAHLPGLQQSSAHYPVELEVVERLVDRFLLLVFDVFDPLLNFRFYLLLFALLLLFGDIEGECLCGGFGGPVVGVVHLYFIGLAGLSEQSLHVFVVGPFFELESFGVVDEE
jgi:hypothetical protein